MKRLGETLPSPELVHSVVKKLTSAGDRAELALWCSTQYKNGSSDQLKCLDLAHTNATMASEQIESKMSTQINAKEERHVIDTYRQIDLARAMLSDQIIVNNVLAHNQHTSDMVKSVYRSIIQKIQDTLQTGDDYMPELLVKELLVEGSMAAAQASLDVNDSFTTSHFRSLAILVHDACRLLSTRYSHINIGKCARIITRRWLVHGDDSRGSAADARKSAADNEPELNDVPSSSMCEDVGCDSEITSEFIMDIGKMNISSGDHEWTSSRDGQDGIKSSNEPSVFGSLTSQRELSDQNISRVALRIAFLMCFAQDYHQLDSDDISEEEINENTDTNIAKIAASRGLKARAKLHKVARRNCFEGDLALAHAKELLGIVFAKQGCTIASTFKFLEDSHDESYLQEEERVTKNKALSFVMRNRALRVASILCPHDVLVRVMLEEEYSRNFDDDLVSKISFGSFLAMEIEAMGLSLPHSDLAQLSTMHFPSYARTLWRHQSDVSVARLGGRLHLLILELSANHHESVDWELFMLMFNEIERNELPRSLLLACECAIHFKTIERAALTNREDVLLCISNAAKNIFKFMSNEVHTNMNSAILNASECSTTVDRFLHIIGNFSESDIIYFVEAFGTLADYCKEQECMDLSEIMRSGAVRVASHLSDPSSMSKLSHVVALHGNEFISCNQSKGNLAASSACVESIQRYEESFLHF